MQELAISVGSLVVIVIGGLFLISIIGVIIFAAVVCVKRKRYFAEMEKELRDRDSITGKDFGASKNGK